MIPDKRNAWLCLAMLCIGLSACNRKAPPPPPATPAPVEPASPSKAAAYLPDPLDRLQGKGPLLLLHAPMTLAELPTTDGQIAIDNFLGGIPITENQVKTRPTDMALLANLIHLRCVKAQYFGTLADYEIAAQLVENMFRTAPKSARSFLARAKLRSTFHEFGEALADLAQAEKLDEDVLHQVRDARAGILAAQGKLEEALAYYHDKNAHYPEIIPLGLEAALLAERGEVTAADDLFMKAQFHYRDVSPFPVAWLYFQHGLMWENAGNLPRARELFAAAVARLPGYVGATSHLAAAENARAQRDRAIALLRPLIETADDPEYKGQLAQLLKDAGDAQAAEALRKQARTQYEALLAKHPRAFASHAARFYLGAGADTTAALKWAEANLAALATTDALTLTVEAATAAGKSARACTLADELSKRPHLWAHSHVVASRAYSACGRRDRATAEATAATVATK